jgi:hypothetical protein
VTVIQAPVTDAAAVTTDKGALQIGYATGDTWSSVTQNVTLPTSGANGTSITWQSSAPGIVSAIGAVARPATTSNVDLTATIAKGSASDTKVFTVVVIEAPAQTATNLLVNPTADQGTSGWMFGGIYGLATMSGSGRTVFYLDSTVADYSFGRQLVVLPSGSGGKWVLMIFYGWVEHSVPGSITRHPYAIGGLQDANANNLDSFQGMIHNADAPKWQTVSGIFQLNAAAYQLYFDLGQGYGGGDDPDGKRGAFDDVGLYVFSTQQEAQAFRDAYAVSHPVSLDTK